MNINERIQHNLSMAFLMAMVFFILLLTFAGCKTCEPVVEVRDSIHTEYKLDSIYVYKHDSIWRDRWRNGDTIYIATEKWRTQYKDRLVIQHDTIRTDKEVVQEVKVVPSFYKGSTIALWVLIACVVLYIGVRITLKFI